ncbi:MAG: tetratricopeptide repeat protein, partial [Gammaproteobacteria bacterium]
MQRILACMLLVVLPAMAGAAETAFTEAYGRYRSLVAEGDFEGALPAAKLAYELGEQLYGPDHANTAGLTYNYGHALLETGNFDAASEILDLAYERYVEVYGEDAPNLIDPLMMQGHLWARAGSAPRNEYYDEAIGLAKRQDDSMLVAQLCLDAGVKLSEQAKSLDAGPYLRDALQIYERELGVEHWRSAYAAFYLAKDEMARGRWSRAERLFDQALLGLEPR